MKKTLIKSTLFDSGISLLYTLCIAIIYLQLNGNFDAVSSLFSVTFVGLFILWTFSIANYVSKNDTIVFGIILVASLHTFFSGMLNGAYSFEFYKPLILFLCTLIYFTFIGKIRLSDGVKRYILYSNLFIALYLIYFAYNHPVEVFQHEGTLVKYLVLNMDNPNRAALFLTCLVFNLSLLFLREKKLFIRIATLVTGIILIVLIYLTESRNSLLALFVFFSAIFFYKKKYRLPKWFIVLISLYPVIFAFVYIYMIDTLVHSNIFDFLISEGKGLDSRLSIWNEGIQTLQESPIIGSYYKVLYDLSHSHLHNTHLHILVVYGILPFILYVKFLYNILKGQNNFSQGFIKWVAFVGFIAIIFLGSGESSMILGTQGIYILEGTLLLLAPDLDERK